jgi:spectinomycin phosphotransferase
VRERPAGVEERELTRILAEGWHIDAAALRYAPVGGGSYHWVVHDEQDRPWFVTVDDLDDKSWLGQTRAAVGEGLRAAMDTACALRHQAGLRFVVAPIPAVQAETVLPLGSKYAVAVFPYIDGTAGRFGEELPAREREEIVDMLVALHRSTPAATTARPGRIELPQRDLLDTALCELNQPWHGGPFAEPARTLLASAAGQVRQMLATFDQLADHVAALPEPVITHGEPHSANVFRAGPARMLIDWDTVGLGPPERDLWMVVTRTGAEARRYTAATGRQVDHDALAFYRIRWALDDISSFVGQLRTSHRRGAHTEHVWQALNITLAGDYWPQLRDSATLSAPVSCARANTS